MPNDDEIRKEFDRLRKTDKGAALAYLANAYQLDHRGACSLSVETYDESRKKHAKTKGGKGESTEAISVRINEPYFDHQVESDGGYRKLIHTLGHELQHVGQRSEDGWRNATEKAEREFLAYSWELVEAPGKSIPPLTGKRREKAVRRVRKQFGAMSEDAKRRVADRIAALEQQSISLAE
ncbi:MAG: hypothetical protein KDL87_13545 [Verrucomicrobiae bacterium]|nr:hypothetical protein [Verrucomicrobiae bacterium]